MNYQDRVRIASKKYYCVHTREIIRQKTLYKVKRDGRIPRLKTLTYYNIDPETLKHSLFEYVAVNPDTKASQRIQHFYEASKTSLKTLSNLHSNMDSRIDSQLVVS